MQNSKPFLKHSDRFSSRQVNYCNHAKTISNRLNTIYMSITASTISRMQPAPGHYCRRICFAMREDMQFASRRTRIRSATQIDKLLAHKLATMMTVIGALNGAEVLHHFAWKIVGTLGNTLNWKHACHGRSKFWDVRFDTTSAIHRWIFAGQNRYCWHASPIPSPPAALNILYKYI